MTPPKSDDAISRLRDRMTRMEDVVKEHAQSTAEIRNSISVIQVETEHIRELFSTRIASLERSNEILGNKVDQLLNSLSIISADIDKSPMGRSIVAHLSDVNKKVDDHKRILDNVIAWQNSTDGSVKTVKWLATSGVIGLVITLIQLARDIFK